MSPSLFGIYRKDFTDTIATFIRYPGPGYPNGAIQVSWSGTVLIFHFSATQQRLLETGPVWRKMAFATTGGTMDLAIDGEAIGSRQTTGLPVRLPFELDSTMLVIGNEVDGPVGLEPEEV
jgi:hypothetical protein